MEKQVMFENSETVGTTNPIPASFAKFLRFEDAPIDQKLGYPGSERFVAFSFHPTASEVIWNDGLSSGFGKGGWRIFLEFVPIGLRAGHHFGSYKDIGADVILLDRSTGQTYAVARRCAVEFLARTHGRSLPQHHCLCAMQPSPGKEGPDACNHSESGGHQGDAPVPGSQPGGPEFRSPGRGAPLV
jgi:hypothetical protein